MADVTDEMIYEELLNLEKSAHALAESIQDLVREMRAGNRELAEGRARIEALKARLFAGRFANGPAAQ